MPVFLFFTAAMRLWANELTSYEQSEILEHQEIYFVGNTPEKIRAIPQTAQNSGATVVT